jgi:hypothetical protein
VSRCTADEACVDGGCVAVCVELGFECESAEECCVDDPRACELIFLVPTTTCCIPLGTSCQQDPQQSANCCGGPAPARLGADCRDGTCCIQEGQPCVSTADCCQTPVAAQCQVVHTCNIDNSALCCRALGSPCDSECDCCDGYCVDGQCSAVCRPNGSSCVIHGECCSLLCNGLNCVER